MSTGKSFAVKSICGYRRNFQNSAREEWRVQWDGYAGRTDEYTWEPKAFVGHLSLWKEFEKRRQIITSHSSKSITTSIKRSSKPSPHSISNTITKTTHKVSHECHDKNEVIPSFHRIPKYNNTIIRSIQLPQKRGNKSSCFIQPNKKRKITKQSTVIIHQNEAINKSPSILDPSSESEQRNENENEITLSNNGSTAAHSADINMTTNDPKQCGSYLDDNNATPPDCTQKPARMSLWGPQTPSSSDSDDDDEVVNTNNNTTSIHQDTIQDNNDKDNYKNNNEYRKHNSDDHTAQQCIEKSIGYDYKCIEYRERGHSPKHCAISVSNTTNDTVISMKTNSERGFAKTSHHEKDSRYSRNGERHKRRSHDSHRREHRRSHDRTDRDREYRHNRRSRRHKSDRDRDHHHDHKHKRIKPRSKCQNKVVIDLCDENILKTSTVNDECDGDNNTEISNITASTSTVQESWSFDLCVQETVDTMCARNGDIIPMIRVQCFCRMDSMFWANQMIWFLSNRSEKAKSVCEYIQKNDVSYLVERSVYSESVELNIRSALRNEEEIKLFKTQLNTHRPVFINPSIFDGQFFIGIKIVTVKETFEGETTISALVLKTAIDNEHN